MDRPADIRITDLAHPNLSTETRALLAAVAPLGDSIDLSLGALQEAALASADGLDDFGSDIYEEPYAVLCGSLEHDAELSPMGRVSVHAQLVQFLRNRLRLTALRKEHPEIADQAVARPIVIAGMPRSGTTHLHNLLSADPSLRSLPWWEALEPVAPASEAGTTQGRIDRARAGVDQRNQLLPHFDRMHEMTWDHAHEEIHLLAIAGSTMFFDTLGYLPTWREWYVSTDQTPYYRELEEILRALTWLRGGERWVLKSPQHLEQFAVLADVFEDATFVVTHRDPVSITASMATMICYASRLSVEPPIDVARLGRWWARLVEDFLTACVRDRRLLPEHRSVDIGFADFMSDDLATVERIYALADQPFDGETRQAMAAYIAAHPRGRHGRVDYDLSDFGIDADERREALRFYVERFDVPWES